MVTRAALRSALVGPLVTQVAVGILVRPPEFFDPVYFFSTSLVAVVLLGPGSMLIGAVLAEAGGHLVGRRVSRVTAILVAGLLGIAGGLLHFEILSFVLHSPSVPLAWDELVTLPAVRAALALAGAASAVQAVLTAYWDYVPDRARLRSGALRAPFQGRT